MLCGFAVQFWAGGTRGRVGREKGFFFCQFSLNSYTQCGREGTKETRKGNFFTVSRTLQHATNENAIELQVLFASVRHSWHPLPCYSSKKSGDKPGPLTHSSPTWLATKICRFYLLNASWLQLTLLLPSCPSLCSYPHAPWPELLQPSSNWPSRVLSCCHSVCLKPLWLPIAHRTSSDLSVKYNLHELLLRLSWRLGAERGVKMRPEEWAGDLGHVKEFSHYPLSNRKSQMVSFKQGHAWTDAHRG